MYFTSFSNHPIVAFEKVNVCWETSYFAKILSATNLTEINLSELNLDIKNKWCEDHYHRNKF